MPLLSKIQNFIEKLEVNSISEERKKILQPLIDFITEKQKNGEPIRLNFICTHNSRRSHLCQIWAKTMAYYFGIYNIECYSAGTEATALFPKIADTLHNVGFSIEALSKDESNPIYAIKYSDNEIPIIGFSKTLDHPFNPKKNFAAVMTCSQADNGCPFVLGAEKRIPVTYEDPKISDNTPKQTFVYTEKSSQIATEMLYVFQNIK
ncbi:arsenate-mycothiol transferase ArsC [Riemerella anatipestifer]|uniref:Protein-tyrosine-phosphatase n=1 Tax=Riemerella anatipestifer TaxID=34085 RepID=A0AAP6HEA1_RIEAN|nr:protein-tyrosine-phosphatase [Riemerella anatipestifer]MBT0549850.1 protein-tyrosine-phosphatase [Riemerella anatipestifer]MBT0556561.1 protein-tyrosine-phosphatase [Riemerella anatipestifer]MBT0560612.1 protein-tyrosine-phosphatase [Riemerella anatipestifer]MCO7354079.1 protein-tyrosine-phosphatase [Riemerella anatipestifer]MCU7540248.1 protein-tyrosine-phosphatase [Riemerella anatipestifer]